MGETPGRDEVPAELLAMWGPVSDSFVFLSVGCAQIEDYPRDADRIEGWAGSATPPSELEGLWNCW